MADSKQYLHEQTTAAQGKYAYFLLAAAASGIALAVNSTSEAILEGYHGLLGAAVVCWALSFLFGCLHLRYVTATLQANFALATVIDGSAEIPNDPRFRQWAADSSREHAKKHSDRANKHAQRQNRYLIAGAIFFLLWHIAGMARRTPALADHWPLWL
jgi:hypothetical protein